MLEKCVPDAVFGSLTDITPEFLRARGVRDVLVDLDNTLGVRHPSTPTPEAEAWIECLRGNGFRVVVLSNARNPARAAAFCELLGLPHIARAGKPRRGGFLQAARALNRAPGELVMVGDQIFTDMLGARRSGVQAFWVRPVALDSLFVRLRHELEKPFLRKRGWRG